MPLNCWVIYEEISEDHSRMHLNCGSTPKPLSLALVTALDLKIDNSCKDWIQFDCFSTFVKNFREPFSNLRFLSNTSSSQSRFLATDDDLMRIITDMLSAPNLNYILSCSLDFVYKVEWYLILNNYNFSLFLNTNPDVVATKYSERKGAKIEDEYENVSHDCNNNYWKNGQEMDKKENRFEENKEYLENFEIKNEESGFSGLGYKIKRESFDLTETAQNTNTQVENIAENCMTVSKISRKTDIAFEQCKYIGIFPDDALYYIIKPMEPKNIIIGMRQSVWTFAPQTEKKLFKQFMAGFQIILIYTARKSGEFHGIARLLSTSQGNTNCSCAIQWITENKLSYDQVRSYIRPKLHLGEDGLLMETWRAQKLCNKILNVATQCPLELARPILGRGEML